MGTAARERVKGGRPTTGSRKLGVGGDGVGWGE